MNVGTVSGLYIYPVKGLSPQRLENAKISPEHGFPFDRAFALARHGSDYRRNPALPLQSSRFHMLSADPRLAGLRTEYDPATGQFQVHVGEHVVLSCDFTTAGGRVRAGELFAAVLDLPADKAPVIVHATDHNFAYLDSSACPVVNLASVRDLSERAGVDIDPLRFRANLYIDTESAWSEFDWLGQELAIGDDVRIRPSGRAARCAATEVNRVTAVKDVPIPRLLKRLYGHTDFGIYATITRGGLLEPGMTISAPAPTGEVL